MRIKTILWACLAILLVSCKEGKAGNESNNQEESSEEVGNGIYYWRTIFNLSDWDKQFIKMHQIQRLYLRLFDVDYQQDFDGLNRAIPIATTRFESKIPDSLEIVPVIYITTASFHNDAPFSDAIYRRIKAMAKRNGFEKIKEIQLDCDWSKTTKNKYFAMCKHIVELAHRDNIKVSATIRLHQLKSEAPPVDRGVLMLYNTGSLYDVKTRNSILDIDDVRPYLKDKIEYGLPLSLAYPTYGWGLHMRNGNFLHILHETDYCDTSLYRKIDNTHFEVLQQHYLEDHQLIPGDIIRLEAPDTKTILQVKQLVESNLEDSPKSQIIYHLDSLNLSKYSDSDLNTILK